jgi:hypothetical protein
MPFGIWLEKQPLINLKKGLITFTIIDNYENRWL